MRGVVRLLDWLRCKRTCVVAMCWHCSLNSATSSYGSIQNATVAIALHIKKRRFGLSELRTTSRGNVKARVKRGLSSTDKLQTADDLDLFFNHNNLRIIQEEIHYPLIRRGRGMDWWDAL